MTISTATNSRVSKRSNKMMMTMTIKKGRSSNKMMTITTTPSPLRASRGRKYGPMMMTMKMTMTIPGDKYLSHSSKTRMTTAMLIILKEWYSRHRRTTMVMDRGLYKIGKTMMTVAPYLLRPMTHRQMMTRRMGKRGRNPQM